MKKGLLTAALLMGTWVASSQVGIGTLNPNKSAQLDVVASDKGILIPRVSLTSVTDTTTIKNGNVESLLVYNASTGEGITPGYYYWFDGEWRKLLTPLDVSKDVLTVLNHDPLTDLLTYVDEDKVTHTFKLNNTKNTDLTLDGTVLKIKDTDNVTHSVDLQSLMQDYSIVSITFDPVTNKLTILDSENVSRDADLSDILKAKNGLRVQDKHVLLGGDFTENTTLTTTGFDFNVKGLPQTNTVVDRKVMMVDDASGTLRVATAKQIVDEVTNVDVSVADNTVTVTVNGKTDTDTIIKTNTLTVNGPELTSTVNGITGTVNLESTITTYQNTSSVANGVNTKVTSTVTGKNTEYKVDVATASGTTLGVVKEAAANPTVFINANGELSTTAWAGNNIVEVTADYPINVDDVVVLGNATEDITITLPSAAGIKGRKLTVKKSDASNYTYVNVLSSGGTIDGEVDMYTSLPFSGWDFMSDGTDWKIVNKF